MPKTRNQVQARPATEDVEGTSRRSLRSSTGREVSPNVANAAEPGGEFEAKASTQHAPDTTTSPPPVRSPIPISDPIIEPSVDAPLDPQMAADSQQHEPAQQTSSSISRMEAFMVYLGETLEAQKKDLDRISATVEQVQDSTRDFHHIFDHFQTEINICRSEKTSADSFHTQMDLLALNLTGVGRKANEVEGLRLELELMRGRLSRLEEAQRSSQIALAARERPASASERPHANQQKLDRMSTQLSFHNFMPDSSRGAFSTSSTHGPTSDKHRRQSNEDSARSSVADMARTNREPKIPNKRPRLSAYNGNDAHRNSARAARASYPPGPLAFIDDHEDLDHRPTNVQSPRKPRRSGRPRGRPRGRSGVSRQSLPSRLDAIPRAGSSSSPSPDLAEFPTLSLPDSTQGENGANNSQEAGPPSARSPLVLFNEHGQRLTKAGKVDTRGRHRRKKAEHVDIGTNDASPREQSRTEIADSDEIGPPPTSPTPTTSMHDPRTIAEKALEIQIPVDGITEAEIMERARLVDQHFRNA